jgi:hypothetical protein
MEVLHPRCAGLDVHKETVVARADRVGPTVEDPCGEREVRR